MASGKATVQIVGNLSRDPEVRSTNTGMAVVNFSVAVNTTRGRGDSGQEEVHYIDCKAFDKRGEAFAKFHKKGSRVAVDGRLTQENWIDKPTGAKRNKLVVIVDNWVFCGDSRGQGGQPQEREPASQDRGAFRDTVPMREADDQPF